MPLPYALDQFLWMLRSAVQLMMALSTGAYWLLQMVRLYIYGGCMALFFLPHIWWYLTSANIIRRVAYRSSETTRRRNIMRVLEDGGVDLDQLLCTRKRSHSRGNTPGALKTTPTRQTRRLSCDTMQPTLAEGMRDASMVSTASSDGGFPEGGGSGGNRRFSQSLCVTDSGPLDGAAADQQKKQQQQRRRRPPPRRQLADSSMIQLLLTLNPADGSALKSLPIRPDANAEQMRSALVGTPPSRRQMHRPRQPQPRAQLASGEKQHVGRAHDETTGAAGTAPPSSPPSRGPNEYGEPRQREAPCVEVGSETIPYDEDKKPSSSSSCDMTVGDHGENLSSNDERVLQGRRLHSNVDREPSVSSSTAVPPVLPMGCPSTSQGGDEHAAGQEPFLVSQGKVQYYESMPPADLTHPMIKQDIDAFTAATRGTDSLPAHNNCSVRGDNSAAAAAGSQYHHQELKAVFPFTRQPQPHNNQLGNSARRGEEGAYHEGINQFQPEQQQLQQQQRRRPAARGHHTVTDTEEEDEEDRANLHNRATVDIVLPVPLDSLMKALEFVKQVTRLQRKKFPIVIAISGGAWIIGSHMWCTMLARVLALRGYLVFCPDYRNFPQTTMEGMTLDVSDAIAWVLANAERYNGDLDNVTILSQSAGAHLTMMSLISQAQVYAYRANGNGKDGTPAPSDVAYNVPRYNPRKSIHRYVGLSGMYNIESLLQHLHNCGLNKPVLYQLAGGREQLARFSVPIYFDQERSAQTGETLPENIFDFLPQRMFFLHGDADKTSPATESADLVKALRCCQREFTARRKAHREAGGGEKRQARRASQVIAEDGAQGLSRGDSCLSIPSSVTATPISGALALGAPTRRRRQQQQQRHPPLHSDQPLSPVGAEFIVIPGAGHTDAIVEECIAAGKSCCVDFLCDYEAVAEQNGSSRIGSTESESEVDTGRSGAGGATVPRSFRSGNTHSSPSSARGSASSEVTSGMSAIAQRADGILPMAVPPEDRRWGLRLSTLFCPF